MPSLSRTSIQLGKHYFPLNTVSVAFMFVPLSFSPLITLHIEYLSLLHSRIKILSPNLVRGRQSKPIFLPFPFRVISFPPLANPLTNKSSYRAIVRPSGLSLSLTTTRPALVICRAVLRWARACENLEPGPGRRLGLGSGWAHCATPISIIFSACCQE